jgi:hypothetical protein
MLLQDCYKELLMMDQKKKTGHMNNRAYEEGKMVHTHTSSQLLQLIPEPHDS